MRPGKAVAKTTEKTTGQLVPQPHGGALRHGGTNKGGPGRTPSVVRALAREAWVDRLPILADIADGKLGATIMVGESGKEKEIQLPAYTGERIRAMAELSKVGMGGTVTMDDVRERLAKQVVLIRTVLPAQHADVLLAKLGEIWR